MFRPYRARLPAIFGAKRCSRPSCHALVEKLNLQRRARRPIAPTAAGKSAQASTDRSTTSIVVSAPIRPRFHDVYGARGEAVTSLARYDPASDHRSRPTAMPGHQRQHALGPRDPHRPRHRSGECRHRQPQRLACNLTPNACVTRCRAGGEHHNLAATAPAWPSMLFLYGLTPGSEALRSSRAHYVGAAR